jgi:hypothetical protein
VAPLIQDGGVLFDQGSITYGLLNDVPGKVGIAAGTSAEYGGSFETASAAARLHFGAEFSPLLAGHTVQIGNADFASHLTLAVGGKVSGTTYDKIIFNGSVEFTRGSALSVRLTAGLMPAQGDDFDIFDYAQAPLGSCAGFERPALATCPAWDTSDLWAGGMLRVSAVPEPETGARLLAGPMLTTRLARRRGCCR